jgi:hypothetical protein
MSDIRRFSPDEISIKRVISGMRNRINDIPHTAAWYLQSYSFENRKKIKSYKNCHIGERCFIIANGPSLSTMNLDLLSNEISFGLNRIYLNFENSSFRPTYYVAANELVVGQFQEDISKLNMPKFLNWNKRSGFKTNDPNIIFIKPKLVVNDYFEKDLTHPFVFGGTVTFVTLQLAYYMGFQTVILLGLDHNYVEKGIPNQQETRNQTQDKSHFHPNYFPKGSKWQLPDLERSEFDYQIARDVFEKDGREIIDATPGGKCTIFQKTLYELLF